MKPIEIKAPNLNSSQYGKDIEEVFTNIDKNFKAVTDRDFIKGEDGGTIVVEYVKLIKDLPSNATDSQKLGNALYKALCNRLDKYITNITNSNSNLSIENDEKNFDISINGKSTKVNWDYDIDKYNVSISKIYQEVTNETTYVGSGYPLLFSDYRFSSNVMNQLEPSAYAGVTDLSCIVNFKFVDNEWVCELNYSFPKLKYNEDFKFFEWIINVDETGGNSTLRATGVKGDRGDKGRIWLCSYEGIRGDELNESYIQIDEYIGSDGTSELISNIPNIDDTKGDTVIVFLRQDGDYVGTLYSTINEVVNNQNDTIWLIPYSNNNMALMEFNSNTIRLFESLHINNIYKDGDPAQGLFLPAEKQDPLDNDTSSKESFSIYCDTEKSSGSDAADTINLNIKKINNYQDFKGTDNPNYNPKYTKSNIILYDNIISKGSNIVLYPSKETNVSSSKDLLIDTHSIKIDETTPLYVSQLWSSDGSDPITVYNKVNIDNELSVSKDASLANTTVNGELEVTGKSTFKTSVVFVSDKTSTGDVTIEEGKVKAPAGFFHTSDARLKEFKEDINVDLDKLSLLPKKYFTWKLDKSGKIEIGTSAQEVQKLYPELVSKNADGTLVVAYDKLSIIALQAIDVLNNKNKELEARIERLEEILLK